LESEEKTLIRAYTTPVPRAREGRAVAQLGCATAMIDTSDGFLGDLGHICEESGAGAELLQDSLPVSGALRQVAPRLGKDPGEFILGPSDDYELIITCPPECVDGVRSAIAATSAVPVSLVGRITAVRGDITLVLPGGGRRRVTRGGWDHFAS
jgi:thiamine-monophosphate kinase